MSDILKFTGTLEYTDETSGEGDYSYSLEDIFGQISVSEHNKVKRDLIDTDGTVTIDLGGITTVKGFIFYIRSGTGTVTIKHDSNSTGAEITKFFALYGEISDITIETTSTQTLKIEYVVVE